MRCLFALGSLAGVLAGLTHSQVAQACGASAPPYYAVEQQAPTGGATPLNAPIVVKLREDPSGPVVLSLDPRLTLSKVGSDVALALKSVGGVPNLAWVPAEPLEPRTTYEAHFNPGYEGVPDTIWPFTTGTESTPPLSFDGKLEVTFEPGTDKVYECPNAPLCGSTDLTDCTSRTVDVTKARVAIPRTIGGFPGIFGTLWLTDDHPYDFSPGAKTAPQPYQGGTVSVMGGADLDDPSVKELLVTVPNAEVAYRPCFAFAASDARGDQAVAEPLCLDAPISPPVVENDGDPGLGNDIERSGTSTSCSLGRGPSSQGAWLVLLGASALSLRNSRRRRRR